jgi:integrase-like protein
VEWLVSFDDARQKLAKFREHYNYERPHSALADRTPAAFAERHKRVTKNSSTSMERENHVKSGELDRCRPKSLVSIGAEKRERVNVMRTHTRIGTANRGTSMACIHKRGLRKTLMRL